MYGVISSGICPNQLSGKTQTGDSYVGPTQRNTSLRFNPFPLSAAYIRQWIRLNIGSDNG